MLNLTKGERVWLTLSNGKLEEAVVTEILEEHKKVRIFLELITDEKKQDSDSEPEGHISICNR